MPKKINLSESNKPVRILRLKEVLNRVGMSRSWLYESISNNTFPAPITISRRAVGWTEDSVNNWLLERIANSEAFGPVRADNCTDEQL